MKRLVEVLDRNKVEAEIRKLWAEQQAAELDGHPSLAREKADEIDARLERLYPR